MHTKVLYLYDTYFLKKFLNQDLLNFIGEDIRFIISSFFTVFTLLGIVLFIYRIALFIASYIESKKYCYENLIELGVADNNYKVTVKDGVEYRKPSRRKLKIRKRENYYSFLRYNKAFSLEDFEKLTENFEHIYNIKINHFERVFRKNHPSEVRAYFDVFLDFLGFETSPELKYGQFWLGRDALGQNIVQDTIKDFKNTLLILAPKGSGKGIAIRSIITSFFEADRAKFAQRHKLIVVDDKGTDFIDFKKKYNAKIYNPTDIVQFENIVNLLSQYISELEQFKLFLQENDLSPSHWDDLNMLENRPTPYFFVFDELEQYTSSSTLKIKKSKDNTEEEKEELRRQALKTKISLQINKLTALYRVSGTIIIGSTQDSRSTSYLWSFTNFTEKLISKQNQAQSLALTGNSKLATSKELVRGRFIYISEDAKKIQVPYCELPKIQINDQVLRASRGTNEQETV